MGIFFIVAPFSLIVLLIMMVRAIKKSEKRIGVVKLTNGEKLWLDYKGMKKNQTFVRVDKDVVIQIVNNASEHSVYIWRQDEEYDIYRAVGEINFKQEGALWNIIPYGEKTEMGFPVILNVLGSARS